MGNIPLEHGLIVATILFALGFYGVMVRRNLLFMLMSLEIMMNAAALAFVLLVPETIPLHLPQHRLRLPPHATLSKRRLVRVVPRPLLTHPLVHVYPAVRDKTSARGYGRKQKVRR